VYLKQCLASIEMLSEDRSFPAHEVIVADGDSNDGTTEYLKTIPELTKLRLNLRALSCPNFGWPYSANEGLKAALGEWIALTNPDLVFTHDFFPLWRFASRTGHQVLSVGLRTNTGIQSANREVTLSRMFFLWTSLGKWLDRRLFSWYYVKSFYYNFSRLPMYVDHPLASFILIKRDAILKAGFLSNRYFLYLADSDFAKRLTKANIKIVHLGNLTFLHGEGYSIRERSKDAYLRLMKRGMMQYARDWSYPSILQAIFLLDKLFSRAVAYLSSDGD